MEFFIGFISYIAIGFVLVSIAKVVGGALFDFDPEPEALALMAIMWPLFVFICCVVVPVALMAKLFKFMFG